ncbi:hypothetical protein M5X11_25600 [Paenibacillus alginolyticus]|uniref:hypothetical protein n=1 Tax=Paenibacillus alginolyticus TaxID=59839 RepID=UPI000492AEA2|nr:hypothetical protein [Paenibacillus alginolyticus]MCY9668259.1 hypothetical protein [Paenibacillus alginolyticus]
MAEACPFAYAMKWRLNLSGSDPVKDQTLLAVLLIVASVFARFVLPQLLGWIITVNRAKVSLSVASRSH